MQWLAETLQVNLNLVLNEDDSNFYKNVPTTKILDNYQLSKTSGS